MADVQSETRKPNGEPQEAGRKSQQRRSRKQTWNALTAPFDFQTVKIKVQATSADDTKGMVVAYIDARDLAERLDEVVGPTNWHDDYEGLSSNPPQMICRLTIGSVTKSGVGKGDDFKEAESDAMKRAGVKFGIGRYLYRLRRVWAELNERGFPEKSDAALKRDMGLQPS